MSWNEPYQKLASCDASGVIFVWIKYEGRWSIELINDRKVHVNCFAWSHDGRMALICYKVTLKGCAIVVAFYQVKEQVIFGVIIETVNLFCVTLISLTVRQKNGLGCVIQFVEVQKNGCRESEKSSKVNG